METQIDLNSSDLYLNRELSLLEFNWRVLQQALDPSVPLLERLNYLCISSTNLDEFLKYELPVLSSRSKLAIPTWKLIKSALRKH